ncbi:MAG: MFS transporter [bacterium]|nr:MFS transporter [bacterium]
MTDTDHSNVSAAPDSAVPQPTAPSPQPSPQPSPLGGLLTAQFFGAFNDNAFKMIVALIGIAAVAPGDEAASQAVTTFAFVILTLPLMLGSVPAMVFGDRVSKRSLLVGTKLAEVVLMAAGTLALWLMPSGWLPLVVLGGMGLQSAFFSPAKYGILPETLPHDRLAAANGKLEAASFLAIILGTVAGGWLLDAVPAPWFAGAALTAFAVVGLVAALRVPHVPPAGCDEPAVAVIKGAWRAVRGDRTLWLATLGSAVFWGLASLLGQDVLIYGKAVLEFSDKFAGVPYALFAIGVGGGAMLAGWLSKGKVETGLIPLGAIGLSVGVGLFGLLVPGRIGTFVIMTLLGVASGFLVVPLNALVQWRAPEARRGAVIALYNGLSFAGVLIGNLGCLLLASLGANCAVILLVAAALTAVATAWAIWLLPSALLRTIVILLAHTLYRVTIRGGARVPEKGSALLVPNHVSFMDGLFLLAATDRPIRFVVDQYWYERPYLKPFLRALNAIPVSAAGGPRLVLKALRDAGKALEEGELVCLFAEGEISRVGSTLPFRRGLERIVRGRDTVIVPVHLDCAYGSLLSAQGGRVQWLPTRIPCPVTVSFGEPLPTDVAPAEIRSRVEALAGEAWELRAERLEPLHHELVRVVRRGPWRRMFADSTGKAVSRGKALAGAIVLARRLRSKLDGQQNLGILLPPSIGGALSAFAASLSGRAAVTLNFTVGPAALASAIGQAELRTIVTSKVFLERMSIEVPPGVELIMLEDLLADVTFGERVGAMLAGLFLPVRRLEAFCGASRPVERDDTAVIVFSSGSTGEPKGIVLSHGNVQANSDAVAQLLPLSTKDGALGVLPLFHSFGYFALWYVSQQGAVTVFHPSPLDAAVVGELVARHGITVLLATPTFLQLYQRRCEPGQFGSLRIVLTAAEKLTDRLADAFHDRFGIRPVQGYGATETSPAIAVSSPGFRAAGFYQAGSRRGSVGRPLPGVVVRIVDPETREPLPVGEAGLVLAKGANVMQGYLGREDLTAEVMHDGFYVTGDIGRLDAEGFLFLTDRLSRFSKIGGEMVPHGTIEEHLQEIRGGEERVFAVTAVPDAKKGERLIVLTTVPAADVPEVVTALGERGLPALFVPRADQFVAVDELPVLGTGKLDLRGIKQMALELAGSEVE